MSSPITVVSGLPGAGKSLYGISLALKAKKEGHQVFEIGIDGMDPAVIPPSPVPFEEWTKLPKGSLLVVDEAHKFLPVRSPGKPPKFIQDLTEIRHFGILLVLITQDPRNLDAFVRRLVGEHYHLSRKMGFPVSAVYTFQGLSEDPNDYFSRKTATASVFKYPSALFATYKSSTMHLVKKKVPIKLVFFAILIVAFPFLVWRAVHTVKTEVIDKDHAVDPAAPKSSSDSKEKESVDAFWSTPANAVKMSTPLVEGVPWTKPIFKGALKVQAQPRLYCVIIGPAQDPHGLCKCYTEQITRVETNQAFCRDVALNGIYNPFQPPLQTSPIQTYAPDTIGRLNGRFGGGEPQATEGAGGSPASASQLREQQVPHGTGDMVLAPVRPGYKG